MELPSQYEPSTIMGATGWSYFVPYEADVSAALQRLRENVFARGDYAYGDGLANEQRQAILEKARPEMDSWLQKVNEQAATLQEPFKTKYLEMAEKIKVEIMGGRPAAAKPKQRPTTIKKLLEFQAENGTHSIIDVVEISSEPEFGAVTPFPRSKLIQFFGTDKPSHQQIEEVHDFGSLEEFVSGRWQGIYIIAYHDGSPAEIFFAGCSGD